jgi:hypothetical protein
MTTLHQLRDLKPNAAMLADDVGRKILDNVISGRFRYQDDLELAASACGRGAPIVKATSHFQVAKMLADRMSIKTFSRLCERMFQQQRRQVMT